MNIPDTISRSKPVSQQVQELLRSRILRGSYPPGERMPSEERLSQELNVSRATVRTALAALAAEGLVRRRHGDGTYPTPHTIEITVRAREAWDIERQIQSSGRTPSIRVLEQGLRPATADESRGLALEAGEPVLVIRRLFLADGVPVMLAVHIVRGQGLATESIHEAARMPLLEFLVRYARIPAGAGEVHFKALPSETDLAAALDVEPGSPLLLIKARLLDDQDRPLLLACEYYRGQEGFRMPVAPFQE